MSKGRILLIIALIATFFIYSHCEDKKMEKQFNNNTYSYNNTYGYNEYTSPYTGSSSYTQSKRDCTSCYATGDCETCNGTGNYNYDSKVAGSWCRACNGSGDCTACGGKGYYMF